MDLLLYNTSWESADKKEPAEASLEALSMQLPYSFDLLHCCQYAAVLAQLFSSPASNPWMRFLGNPAMSEVTLKLA